MSNTAPQDLRLGAFPALKPFRRVDSRTCNRCGARAGYCDHLAVDEDIVWLSRGPRYTDKYWRWSPDRKAKVLNLHAAGFTRTEIAEALNTTADAIAGVLFRERSDRA